MANANGWGDGASNNNIGWGKGADNAIGWGDIHADSYAGLTDIVGVASFTNTLSTTFDGIDDYVDCSSAISSISTDNEGTFSLWYKPSSLSTNMNIITLSNSSASDVYFIIGWSNPSFLNNVFVQLRNGFTTTGFLLQTDTSPLIVGVWTHIAVVQNGVSAVIYINGIAVPQTFFISNNPQKWLNDLTINEFNIGKLVISSGSFNFTNGNLDEVSYFSSALSGSDILTIFNGGVPNDIASLSPVSWWRMGDGSTYPTINDEIGSNNGTIVNMSSANFVTDVPT